MIPAQLRLPTTTGVVSLREALEAAATQWSQRLGVPVRVVEVSNGGGYRIGPAS